jgi:chromatin segregation and condensation protein Rec8/ScpA/Scc1 (kleisin family)
VFSRAAVEPDLDHLDLDLPSVELAIEDLQERLRRQTFSSFEELTEHCHRPMEVAAYFLALLEMARWGLIEVSQADWTAAIEVRHLEDGSVDLSSEWAS